jgi:lactate permease
METVLALLPVFVIFPILFAFRQSAVRAGFAAFSVAIFIAVFSPVFHVTWPQILESAIKGSLITLIVAYVLFFGILLFHLMNEKGLIRSIASFVANSTADPVRQVMILVIAFSPLIESVTGFGIAILVTAPLLVALGFERQKAAILSLTGLSAVPWGALATGTVIGASLSGIPLRMFGAGSALLTLPTFFYFAWITVWLTGGWKEVRKRGVELAAVAGSLAGSVWLFSTYISVELAGVLGSMVAIGVEWLFIRGSVSKTNAMDRSGDRVFKIGKAVSPYLILTLILLMTRLVSPVESFLSTHAVLDLPGYSFRLPVMYSPGFPILITCLFTIFMFNIGRLTVLKAVRSTVAQWWPVTLSTFLFVSMSQVMLDSGMTSTLAHAAALLFGSAFVAISPLIGGMGGFLTGSNAAANAMFIQLQMQTAHQLGLSPELLASGQNTSASHMTMASPTRVLLSRTVCGISSETRLLKQSMLIASGSLLIILMEIAVRSYW